MKQEEKQEVKQEEKKQRYYWRARNVNAETADYIESRSWSCSKSPNGAHHWVAETESKFGTWVWRCKYCNETKDYVIPETNRRVKVEVS